MRWQGRKKKRKKEEREKGRRKYVERINFPHFVTYYDKRARDGRVEGAQEKKEGEKEEGEGKRKGGRTGEQETISSPGSVGHFFRSREYMAAFRQGGKRRKRGKKKKGGLGFEGAYTLFYNQTSHFPLKKRRQRTAGRRGRKKGKKRKWSNHLLSVTGVGTEKRKEGRKKKKDRLYALSLKSSKGQGKVAQREERKKKKGGKGKKDASIFS